MPTYNFDEVSVKATRRWKDPVTGKPRQETRKFWQTINPFNKNSDGLAKTRREIMSEISAEARAWMDEAPLSDPQTEGARQ